MVTARKSGQHTGSRQRPAPAVAHVTTKGQITIPKAIRDYFDLKPGDDVVFLPHRDGVLIQRSVKDSPFAEWRGYLRDLKGEDVDDLIEEMRGR